MSAVYNLSDYNLIRADHQSSSEHRGVCFDQNKFLPLNVLNMSYHQESINCETVIGRKTLIQTKGEFENVIDPFCFNDFFLYSLKTSEIKSFLMFSGGIERDR